jgi:Protein of unknown function (DUF992)
MSGKGRCAAVLATIILSAAFGKSAFAGGGIQVGTLTCNASSSWGFIFGSTREVDCTFTSPDRVEQYRGQISKFGIDIGYTEGGVLIWTVVAPTATLHPGDLAGNYGGATASATVGIGVGAYALVGGSMNSVALQPLSIEANRGLDVAGGVASMSLVPAR